MQKQYSRADLLPTGHASGNLTPGCLILEGGAFRGVFTSGVLDVLMEENLNFQTVIGVSAGALNGVNYVAGQIGRSALLNLCYRHDSRWVGYKSMLHSHGVVGFEFLFETFSEIVPFDKQSFEDPRRRFVAVAANCVTGKPAYFERNNCSDIFQAVRASASMPYVSRMVEVDGVPHLDGGCSDNIPINWALSQGYEKIVVVRTRHKGYRCEEKQPLRMQARMYRNYPEFWASLRESDARYNRTCDRLDELDAKGRIFSLYPSRPITIRRLEGDVEKLGELYFCGREDVQRALPAIREYLSR